MGAAFTSLQLSENEIERIKEVLNLCKYGTVAIKTKTVKSSNYKALLPLDDLEIQKGKEVLIAQLIPGKIYLLKIE